MKLKHLKIFKNFKKQTMSNEQFVVLVFDKMEKSLGTINGFSEKEISIFVESGRHNFYETDVFKSFMIENKLESTEIGSLVVAKIIEDNSGFEHTPYQFKN
jgi:hypothetical protein